MNHNRTLKCLKALFIGQVFFWMPGTIRAQDTLDNVAVEDTLTEVIEEIAEEVQEEEVVAEVAITGNSDNGKALFQGGASFENGGPSCIACHNVNDDDIIPGGLFAKDLTDVYSRLGEGLTSWLSAPPFPAMATAYNNNPLTEQERADLTAFFKSANGSSTSETTNSGYAYFFIGGGIGLICLLGLIQLLWSRRKTKMVKEDIFNRQRKAWDAKF